MKFALLAVFQRELHSEMEHTNKQTNLVLIFFFSWLISSQLAVIGNYDMSIAINQSKRNLVQI